MNEERIRNVMAITLGVPPSAIGDDASPDTLAAWDSLRHMNLILAIERMFGIEFSDAELGDLTTFTAIKRAVTRRTATAA
jgi:acyl carrier protein